MKRFALLLIFVFGGLQLSAQSRKKVAHYSLFQAYFNPALTGFEGSQIRTFFRDQWVGFEEAPRTVFISGELNLSDVGVYPNKRPVRRLKYMLSNHQVGFGLLRDSFGPFKDTQFNLSYSTRVLLNRRVSLRAGVALAYEKSALDLTGVVIDRANDPSYQRLFATDYNRLHKLDINAGLTLTGQDFYVGYAIQDLGRGLLNNGAAYLDHTYGWHHVIQGGYRRALSEEVGLVATGIFRYDNRLKETLEGHLKGVWQNMFSLGLGYRKDQALTASTGLHLNQYRLGYAREVAAGKADGINAGTNEVMVTYNLAPVRFTRRQRARLTVW